MILVCGMLDASRPGKACEYDALEIDFNMFLIVVVQPRAGQYVNLSKDYQALFFLCVCEAIPTIHN